MVAHWGVAGRCLSGSVLGNRCLAADLCVRVEIERGAVLEARFLPLCAIGLCSTT
ncbi:unnamed protein product, partial [Didymodactylos carnosus]